MDELRHLLNSLDVGERAVLAQLSHNRPTEDGDIIGKPQRNSLIAKGLAFRSHGRTTLTRAGVGVQILLGEDTHAP